MMNRVFSRAVLSNRVPVRAFSGALGKSGKADDKGGQTFDYDKVSEGVAENVVWSEGLISKQERQEITGRKGATLWFTGLSGSGKSTLACNLEAVLLRQGIHCYRLDGDNVRFGLNKDLGFSDEARTENIRRIGEVSKLFADSGSLAITAFISPFIADRECAREVHEKAGIPFVEVLADVSLEVAESRDPKGLYKKARKGEIPEFTGITSPYEVPLNPEVKVPTDNMTVPECTAFIIKRLKELKLVPDHIKEAI